MHPVNLIARGLDGSDKDYPALAPDFVNGICAVTGIEGQCVPRKTLFGKSFCDGETLAAPSSVVVSVDAYITLKYKWERMSSWVCCESGFKKLSRVGVREAVLSESITAPWCGYATTSYKKHGALRAPINYSQGQNKWLFETRLVDCSDIKKVAEWWSILNKALRLGAGRSVLETLNCPPFVMRKIGLSEWVKFELWAKPRAKSSLYAFLCYLLPSQEELKNEERYEDIGVETPRQKSIF